MTGMEVGRKLDLELFIFTSVSGQVCSQRTRHWMTKSSLKICCTSLLFLLAGCGVGSTEPQSQEISCEKPWTWANTSGQGAQSFSPKNILHTAEVSWELQNCPIKRQMSAVLNVCIDHSHTSDLSLELYRGNSPVPVTLPKLSETSQSGSCGNSELGLPWTYSIDDLPLDSAYTAQTWRLVVRDTGSKQIRGTFVGWSFSAKGFN